MKKAIEAIPLAIFLIISRGIDGGIFHDWKEPFLISTSLAVIVIAYFLFNKHHFNRIFLAINMYLISGGLAFLTHQSWLNRLYGHLLASGMILWIIFIGIISSFFSPHGFIGVNSNDRNAVRKYSIYLLLYSACAFAISFVFRGNRMLSEIIPFAGLFVMQGSINARFTKENES